MGQEMHLLLRMRNNFYHDLPPGFLRYVRLTRVAHVEHARSRRADALVTDIDIRWPVEDDLK